MTYEQAQEQEAIANEALGDNTGYMLLLLAMLMTVLS